MQGIWKHNCCNIIEKHDAMWIVKRCPWMGRSCTMQLGHMNLFWRGARGLIGHLVEVLYTQCASWINNLHNGGGCKWGKCCKIPYPYHVCRSQEPPRVTTLVHQGVVGNKGGSWSTKQWKNAYHNNERIYCEPKLGKLTMHIGCFVEPNVSRLRA